MKILVIGAAGKTANAIVEQATDEGHQVTAFVHDADGSEAPAGVRVVEGDAAAGAAMDAAVLGQDAVPDTTGGNTPYKATTLQTSVANTIVDCMRRNGVRRLVVTPMIGEGDSRESSTIYERPLLSTVLRGATRDKTQMARVVATSGLDRVVVRPDAVGDPEEDGEAAPGPVTAQGASAGTDGEAKRP